MAYIHFKHSSSDSKGNFHYNPCANKMLELGTD